MNKQLIINTGIPNPLGASWQGEELNFSLFSEKAETVTLCLFNRNDGKLLAEIPLLPEINKTGDVWHISVRNLNPDTLYAYRVTPLINHRQHFLLDPYARSLSTSNIWGKNFKQQQSEPIYHPLGEILAPSSFDWEDDSAPKLPLNSLIIYETSVRAFTQDSSSHVKHPGTFLGVIEKIPHLIDLGVNALELLPIQEFNECEYAQTHPNTKNNLYNFWGYSTVNFFSPMNRFASSSNPGSAVREFKEMVKALHKQGIEIILDVVFNHTAEGDETGPVLSFKGIDNQSYYLLDEHGTYFNFSGCGNSLNANQPAVQQMIIDCLCYWVTEMHVDGFRFDLASALTRGGNGIPLEKAPLIQAITNHPILNKVKLIAEPWDAAGLYQVGYFATETKLWSEWNGKYRDAIRRFIKGTPWSSGEFAMRLCGSEDLYHNRAPYTSINFITSHDGFSLLDLVSYSYKHNVDNGEGNRDGHNDNESWNCGVEGETTNRKVLALRYRQMKNFHLALMLSQGVPMITMGDEYGHTKNGNNNTWCQDNSLNWFQWEQLKTHHLFYRFFKIMVRFRKKHPSLKRMSFLTQKDIDWHGLEPFKPDWNSDMRLVVFTLKDHQYDRDLLVAFNAQNHIQLIDLPPPPYSKRWRWVVNTGSAPPSDIFENGEGPIQHESQYRLIAYSAIVLEASV